MWIITAARTPPTHPPNTNLRPRHVADSRASRPKLPSQSPPHPHPPQSMCRLGQNPPPIDQHRPCCGDVPTQSCPDLSAPSIPVDDPHTSSAPSGPPSAAVVKSISPAPPTPPQCPLRRPDLLDAATPQKCPPHPTPGSPAARTPSYPPEPHNNHLPHPPPKTRRTLPHRAQE